MIALIVVGGLIVFSLVWCIVRCACCGLSCCCECCRCLKCCGDCCGCCDPPKGTPHKYLDESYGPTNQGYRSQAPMALPPSRVAEPPQYAEFDVSRKGGEDALPAMPSWDSAGSKKIMVEEDPVELEQLKKPENSGQNMPLMSGAGTSPGPASPVPSPGPYGAHGATSPGPYGARGGTSPGPYGAHDMHAASGGYLSAGASGADPYAQSERVYTQSPAPYGPSSSSLGVDQAYGAGAAAGAAGAAMGPGRRSPRDPRDYNNGGYDGQGAMNPRYPGSRSPPQGSYDEYGRSRQGNYDEYAQGGGRNGGGQNGGQGYGMGPGRRSPPRGPPGPNNMSGAYPPDRVRRSPVPPQAPQGGADYGYNNRPYPPAQPQRQYSSDSTRPLARPPPQRQYSHDMQPPASPSGLTNNSGFDFNSGYSRPQTANDRPSTSQADRNAYPGYRAYQSGANSQEGWSGV